MSYALYVATAMVDYIFVVVLQLLQNYCKMFFNTLLYYLPVLFSCHAYRVPRVNASCAFPIFNLWCHLHVLGSENSVVGRSLCFCVNEKKNLKMVPCGYAGVFKTSNPVLERSIICNPNNSQTPTTLTPCLH